MTKNIRLLLILLIGWYYVLITAHYFGQRPLWNDEQCVLNSVIQFKPLELFSRPLLDVQEFPRFYLWCIQQFSRHWNNHLLALRFLPFVAMSTAFFVWFNVVRSQARNPRTLVFFIACWCASIPLVYHAGELKPYSMDVLVSGIFMLFLYRQQDLQGRPVLYRSLLFLLPLLGIFSYPVIFIYPLLLYNLIREAFLKKRILPQLICYLTGGLCWVLFVYFFDYRVTGTDYLQKSWYDYFISFSSLGVFLKSFGQQFNNLMSRWFADKPRWIRDSSRFFVGSGFLYMLINYWKVFKSEGFKFKTLVPAAFAVFLLHLTLGCLHKYPFSVPRLSLFFSPFLLWMTVLALEWVRGKNKILGTMIEVIFVVYLVFISVGIARVVFACNPSFSLNGPGLGGQSELWK